MQSYFSKSKCKELFLDGLFFVAGGLISAVSVNVFTAPNNIAPGGLTGLATVCNYLFGLPIGLGNILFNIPLFIWGFCAVGVRFLAKTAVAMVIYSLCIDLTVPFMPQYTGDPLLTIAFGGVISGFGLALILMRGSTTGGTDLAASLVSRKIRFLSMGRLILLFDLIIVAISAIVYKNFESPLYAILIIYISTKVIDAVLYGTDSGTGKVMFIISRRNREIAQRIMEDLGRGVTELKSRGCYSGIEGEVLLCAVRRQEVYKTYDIIHSIDPNAFTVVGEAGEITGEGFRQLVYDKKDKKFDVDAGSPTE